MKMKLIFSIIAMFVCFTISGLFFLSSGIFDFNTGNVNNTITLEILKELDNIPFVHIESTNLFVDDTGEMQYIHPDNDCPIFKKKFDNYIERSKLPILENSNSLCHGLNLQSNFSALNPKWAVGKLINVSTSNEYLLTFKGNNEIGSFFVSLRNNNSYEDKLERYYKIDMNNICRYFFMMIDSRSQSPIINTVVEPTEIKCI